MSRTGGLVDRLLAGRNRFPGFLNRAIDYVADHPEGLVGRLAARRLGRIPDSDLPGFSIPEPRDIRVLIAPVNYSGQGRLWARALESSSADISARNMALDVPGGFSFPADLIVPVAAYHNSLTWQRGQRAAVEAFTHILVEAEEPLFGRLLGRDSSREVDSLLHAGIDVAFMVHGTDVRLPSRHRERSPFSPYQDPGLYLARLERLATANLEMLFRWGRPVFVSTPDLLWDVPIASWCPVVVDRAMWESPYNLVEDRPLRVVHAPSSALVKGTHLIEPVLHELHARGVIEYRPIRGVPSAQMPAVYREADVVLDQFRLGSYGVAACEAMAAGKLVIGHIPDDVRETVRRETGLDLPIVQATPATLGQVLEGIDADRAKLVGARDAGMTFVSAVHDGRASARVLNERWLAPPTNEESSTT